MNKVKILIKKKRFWLLLLVVFIYLNNTSILIKSKGAKLFLLAHRGLAQTFPMEGITGNTNTAERIFEPEHPYLENTIESMKAAFHYRADMVEFDIQLTKDGKFAVFHDALLEYRTDGSGSVRDYTMEELKKLDVGYGYTADNGNTYPFRGKGIGLMPSLDEVIDAFPDRSFLIHIKSNARVDGEYLAQYLKDLASARLNMLAVYGGDAPIAVLEQELPNLKVMSRETMKKGLISYMLIGWTGYVPDSMRNTYFHLPEKYTRILWGWPHKFIERMRRADTIAVLVAGNGEWSEGFDSIEALKQLPSSYKGGIWTNRIDKIGRHYYDDID